MNQQTQQKGIRVNFPGHLIGGVYCNLMRITHTREEFIMDFLMVHEGMGAVTSRVIMSPGHVKRTISALQANLKNYEKQFGSVKEAAEPAKGKLGFRTT